MLDGSMSASEEGDTCYDQKSYCKEDDKYVEYGNSYKDMDGYIGQEQVQEILLLMPGKPFIHAFPMHPCFYYLHCFPKFYYLCATC